MSGDERSRASQIKADKGKARQSTKRDRLIAATLLDPGPSKA